MEIVGTNVCHAGIMASPAEPAEVVLRLALADGSRETHRLGMEIVPLVTSGPPV